MAMRDCQQGRATARPRNRHAARQGPDDNKSGQRRR